MGDLGSIPGLGRSPREGKSYLLQYSDLPNSFNCIVHGVTKSQTQLSDYHFHSTFHKLNFNNPTLHPPQTFPPLVIYSNDCISLLVPSHFSHVTLCALWSVTNQAPLSMGFSRQEYWSGWPCPPPFGSSRIRTPIRVSCVFCTGGRFFMA